jgi:hypothetical protein
VVIFAADGREILMNIIATVGRNPLPIFVASKALRRELGDSARVVLLHSESTTPYARQLKEKLPGEVQCVKIDLTNWDALATELRKHLPCHLHYTGGFKFAAIAAFDALDKNCDFSYLDPEDYVLVTSDGKQDVTDLGLNLSTEFLAELHLYRLQAPDNPSNDFERKALAALQAAFPKHQCFGPQYYEHERSRDTHCQIDASVVLNWRLVVIECYDGANRDKSRLKAFEAIFRARQLGGMAAKAMLWCKLDKQAAEDLTAEVRDNADATGTSFQVWGRDETERETGVLAMKLQETLEPQTLQEPTTGGEDYSLNVERQRTLLFTVGKNPVPVTVSLCHLYRQHERQRPRITLLHSKESTAEANAILDCAEKILGHKLPAQRLPVDAYEPKTIEAAARSLGRPVVLDFTGGRKTFGFHAFKALEDVADYHYLSDDHTMISRSAPASGNLRKGWNLTPHLLAQLHGFEVVVDRTELREDRASHVEAIDRSLPHGIGLWRWMRFRRSGVTGTARVFFFHALIVLGYQLLTVFFQETDNVDKLKSWGVQTLTRTRQIGGDGAHALFFFHPTGQFTTEKFRENLHDALGVRADSFAAFEWTSDPAVTAQSVTSYIQQQMGWR